MGYHNNESIDRPAPRMTIKTLTNETREKFGVAGEIRTVREGREVIHYGYVVSDFGGEEYIGCADGEASRVQLTAQINARCTELVAELSVQAEGFNAAPDSTPVDAEQEEDMNDGFWDLEATRREGAIAFNLPCTCGGIDCPECSKPMAYAPVQVGTQGNAVTEGLRAMAEMVQAVNNCANCGESNPISADHDHIYCPGCLEEHIQKWAAEAAPPPSFRDKAQAAIQAARDACLDKARWLVAVEKAAEELEGGRWSYHDGGLKIQSRTSEAIYRVIKGRCSCEAGHRGIACWHRAAWKILKNTNEGQR